MDGSALGFIGGVTSGSATIIGAFLAFFKSGTKLINYTLLKQRLDFFIGLILAISALKIIYPATIEQVININIIAFFLGVLFLDISKNIIKNNLENIIVKNSDDQFVILSIIKIIFKIFIMGLAAGAAINIVNSGESYTLLAIFAFHNLCDGNALAICLVNLGMDPIFSFFVVIFLSVLSIAAGVAGVYFSKENSAALSLIMAFISGTFFCSIIKMGFSLVQKKFRKVMIKPSYVSAIVVMLVIVVWKEIL